jgi:hypothetical protein
MQKSKLTQFKKSEVAYLASFVKEVLDTEVKKDTVVEVNLILFDGSENKTVITSKIKITGMAVYGDLMRMFRRKLGAYITLKASRMNLTLKFGDIESDSGLFTVDYLFTGKKIERYKVFNALFMLSAASFEGMEIVPSDDEI